MQRPRFVVVCVAVLPVALLTAITLTTPATASGPGGWDHLGDGGSPGSDSLNGKVSSLHEGAGVLYVGGDFTDAGGIAAADRIAAWNGSSWSAVSSASQIGTGSVDAIAVSGGSIYAGGSFTNAGGNGNADFLARWDGLTWSPFCNSTGPAFGGNVTSLQIIGPTLYVGGSFQDGAGIPSADYMLACDLASGAPRSTVADPDHPFSGSVYALTADTNGVLYAGGGFTNLENIAAADYVAYNAGAGWNPMGAGGGPCGCAVNTFVRSLTATGTNVYVGTDAKDVAGIVQADNVARWNGSAWSAVGANNAGTDGWFPTGTTLNGLTTFLGHYVFATGTFLDAGGDPRADHVAFFDGTYWHPVGSDGVGNGPLAGTGLALVVFNNLDPGVTRQLYAGGNFTSAGGDPQAHSAASFRMSNVVPFPVPTYSPPPPPTPTPTPTPTPDVAAPQVRVPDLSVSRFRAATSGPAFAAVRVGTVVRFSLSERASVKFTVQRPMAGRKVGGSCVKPTAGNRTRPSCTRWVTVPGSVTKAGKKGANAMTFRGRMGGRTLKPGSYRLRMQATDAAKNVSAYKHLPFTIVR